MFPFTMSMRLRGSPEAAGGTEAARRSFEVVLSEEVSELERVSKEASGLAKSEAAGLEEAASASALMGHGERSFFRIRSMSMALQRRHSRP